MHGDVLSLFHPATARWFRESFPSPTPAQLYGWQQIATGSHTLIVAPTGSGKTLAAFLYAIDERVRSGGGGAQAEQGARGVRVLYISPLKSLVYDIERNLDGPLRGIRAAAEALHIRVPDIRAGVRTGDTSPGERRRMLKDPPDLLVTTPESLHLLLTSLNAREMLRTVRYVIVDEIHAVCPNKRGTFLAVLLERLEVLTSSSPIRIGLSATQRPLEEVGRFLGGYEADGSPRPVAIVDVGMRKDLDLAVLSPVDGPAGLAAGESGEPSVWPSIYEKLLELVAAHTSTLIFGNSRRAVERIAAEMNRRAGTPLARAHHGSVSKEERREIEESLKAGRLPALVATASMELGIDMGAIDLVCQVEAPFSVASGLQRVGRAGHLVRATSVGRMLAKTRADLLVLAGMARGMLRGEISALRVPDGPLDILAQQVTAMVAMDRWTEDALHERIRCAAPYRRLSRDRFAAVLELLTGKYETPCLPLLRPRVSWERASGRLEALPGSRSAAILCGGAIPDSGQYAMVLEDGTTRLGELDEEFVFERRLGETFLLGTGCWRILRITHDRVIVAPADGAEGMMPFWKGEGLGWDAEFGARLGALLEACEARLDSGEAEAWLSAECALDPAAAKDLVAYLEAQRADAVLPNDRRILLDVFPDEAGDERVAVISPFGRAFHFALLLGIQQGLRLAGHGTIDAIYSGEGILLRPGRIPIDAVIEAVRGLRGDRIAADIAAELDGTAFFAMRFRRNAGRALLLPRGRPGRRTPLWLQRLRAHDLLAWAASTPDFPIVAETFREILEDELPLDALRGFLDRAEAGTARFAVRRGRRPSPFSRSLRLQFTGTYLYEADRPVGGRRDRDVRREDGADWLAARVREETVFDPEAIHAMDERLRGTATGHRARDGAELVELLRRVGDLTEREALGCCEPAAREALTALIEDGRIVRVLVAGSAAPERLVAADDAARYRRMGDADVAEIVRRHVASRALAERGEIVARYPAAERLVDDLSLAQGWIEVERAGGGIVWTARDVAIAIGRQTRAARRQRIRAISPDAYVRFLLSRHRCTSPADPEELPRIIDRLAGCSLPPAVWDDVLGARVRGYDRRMLEELVRRGEVRWLGAGSPGGGRRITLISSGTRDAILAGVRAPVSGEVAARVAEVLSRRGALFLDQIAAEIERPPSETAAALWDLVWTGWATNDGLGPAWGEEPRPERWRAGRRGAPWGGGRWAAVDADEVVDLERCDLRGWEDLVLDRYGVVNRDVARRDGAGPPWGPLYADLARREWAGDVDRGVFVSGLAAPQFAARGAVEGMLESEGGQDPILLNLLDPACVYGDLLPIRRSDGARYAVRRQPQNYLVLSGGRPLLAVEGRGERLVPLAETPTATLAPALALLPRLVEGRDRPPAVRVRMWDDRPIIGSDAAAELARLGFEADGRSMTLYRSYGEEVG